jgi:hypothetical protein
LTVKEEEVGVNGGTPFVLDKGDNPGGIAGNRGIVRICYHCMHLHGWFCLETHCQGVTELSAEPAANIGRFLG